MKKAAAGFVLLPILIVCCLWALPYFRIVAIGNAIFESDQQALSDDVDFFALKQNLKNQVKTAVVNVEAFKGDSLPSLVIDFMIDSTVNPAGVIRFSKKAIELSEKKKELNSGWQRAIAILFGGSSGYDSLSTFSYWLPTDYGEVRFVLKRSGLAWKLTNAVIPPEQLDNFLQRSTSHKR